MRPGDIVTRINGRPIRTVAELRAGITALRPRHSRHLHRLAPGPKRGNAACARPAAQRGAAAVASQPRPAPPIAAVCLPASRTGYRPLRTLENQPSRPPWRIKNKSKSKWDILKEIFINLQKKISDKQKLILWVIFFYVVIMVIIIYSFMTDFSNIQEYVYSEF